MRNGRIGPQYDVEVHPDGRVIYTGMGCVGERGTRTKTISKGAAGRLFAMVAHSGFWTWAEEYGQRSAGDMDGILLTVVEGRRAKTIDDYPSCEDFPGATRPSGLCDLEHAVLLAVDVTKWTYDPGWCDLSQ
jgi:hypothetical protein